MTVDNLQGVIQVASMMKLRGMTHRGILFAGRILRLADIPAIVFLPRDKESMAQLIQPIAHGALTPPRLSGRVFALDMATCLPPLCGRREARRRSRARPCDLPFCRRGSLRIIAAITQKSVITCILHHLKLAFVPPPITPARCRQEIFTFDHAHVSVSS
jgi:hypothetical protein